MDDVADNQPGNYYVSVIDGGQYVLALGPFVNDHQGALGHVDAVHDYVVDHDPRGFWYAYGTARAETDRAGKLNDVIERRETNVR